MKKILKYLGFTLLTPIALIILYLGSARILSHLSVQGEKPQDPDITIYILGNDIHTDIIVPVKTDSKTWSQTIPYKNTRGNDTTLQYIAIGWGDKGFYLKTPTWADLKFSTAFNAAFGLSTAAMHATFYKDQPAEGAQCVKLTIGKDQYRRLVDFIDNSLQIDSLGQAVVIPTNMRYDK